MHHDTSCPSCGRLDWVQSIPALRSTGASTVSATDYYSGVGFSSSGLIPVMGTALTERTQVTELVAATRYEPPQVSAVRPLILGLVMAIPAVVVFAAIVSNILTPPAGEHPNAVVATATIVVKLAFALAVASPAAVAFGFVRSRVRRNSLILRGRPAAYALWSAALYCHRCGFCYWPSTATDPRVPTRQPLSTAQFRWAVWNAGGYAHI